MFMRRAAITRAAFAAAASMTLRRACATLALHNGYLAWTSRPVHKFYDSSTLQNGVSSQASTQEAAQRAWLRG